MHCTPGCGGPLPSSESDSTPSLQDINYKLDLIIKAVSTLSDKVYEISELQSDVQNNIDEILRKMRYQ